MFLLPSFVAHLALIRPTSVDHKNLPNILTIAACQTAPPPFIRKSSGTQHKTSNIKDCNKSKIAQYSGFLLYLVLDHLKVSEE